MCLTSSISAISAEKSFGNHELYIEMFDLYYAATGLYFSLNKKPIPVLTPKKEWDIYFYSIKRFFKPNFIVLEVSTYPLPLVGAGIRAWAPNFYEKAAIKEINIIEGVTRTINFPEPWATSLFIGNVVKFEEEGKRIEGRGYVGFQTSYGNYHIKENQIFNDHWGEFEIKLSGQKKGSVRKITWSFRLGGRLHSNPGVRETVYASVFRNRADFTKKKFSFFRNTNILIRTDYAFNPFEFQRLAFEFGKKFPLRNKKKKFAAGFSLGAIIDFNNPYSGALGAGFNKYDVVIILKPLIQF